MLRKSLKRKVLFTLAFLFDIYKELSPRSFYRNLYSPLYEERTITQTLSRMTKVGEIEKKIKNGEVVLHIAAKGESLLNEDINLQYLAKRTWDGLWRVVIFDIEEKSRQIRNMLRDKLKSLGFAMWQESVYITPHPVAEEMNEFFEEKDLFPSCVCFEAKLSKTLDNKELASFLFHLDGLAQSYSTLTLEAENIIETLKTGKINKTKSYEHLRNLVERLQQTMLSDPFVPEELFPQVREREKAQKTIATLTKQLI